MAVLRQLPHMGYSGIHHTLNEFARLEFVRVPERVPGQRHVDWERLERALTRVKRGMYASSHFPASDQVEALLARLGIRPIVIIRDPRDVAVSMAHYAATHPRHPFYRRFTEHLDTDHDRLLAVITGFSADEFGRGCAPLGERLAEYLGWLTSAQALVVRFEDLVGPAGGGSDERQRKAILRIARFVERDLSARDLDKVQQRAWSSGSATFRRGQIGDWQRHFEPAHVEMFRLTAGEQLAAMGYGETRPS